MSGSGHKSNLPGRWDGWVASLHLRLSCRKLSLPPAQPRKDVCLQTWRAPLTPKVMTPSKRSSTEHYVASLPKVTYNTGLQPWALLRDRNGDYSLLSAPLTWEDSFFREKDLSLLFLEVLDTRTNASLKKIKKMKKKRERWLANGLIALLIALPLVLPSLRRKGLRVIPTHAISHKWWAVISKVVTAKCGCHKVAPFKMMDGPKVELHPWN